MTEVQKLPLDGDDTRNRRPDLHIVSANPEPAGAAPHGEPVGVIATEATVIQLPPADRATGNTPAPAPAAEPTRRNVLKWGLLGGLAGAAGLITGGAVAIARSRGEEAAAVDPGSSSGDTQKQTKELSLVTSGNIITYNTNPLYEKLTLKERAIVDKLGQAEWNPGYFAFPREERQLFAQFMFLGQGLYAAKQVADNNAYIHYEKPVPADTSNTYQEIVNQWAAHFAELTWVLTRNGSPTAIDTKRQLALKMLDGIYGDDARQDDYAARVTSLKALSDITGANDGYEVYTAMEGADTTVPVPRKRINFYNRGDRRQRAMELVEFPGVAGMPPEKRWVAVRSYAPADKDYMQLS